MSDVWVCPECGTEFNQDRKSAINQHKYQRHNLDTESYIERYKRIKTEIPERYSEAYESITGSGRAPKTVQAAVCYIESDTTLDKAAEIFDKSSVTISKMVKELIEHDAVTLEYVRENNHDNGFQVFGEDRNKIDESDTQYNSDNIQKMRKDLGLSKSEFGRKVGVSSQTVSGWENGDYNPSPRVAKRISENIDV